MSEKNYNYRPSLVWPLLLIGVGVMFLLENLGVINEGVWRIAYRLWPLVLIALGLDVLMGRRPGWWPAITVVLILGMFAAGAWLVGITGQVFDEEILYKNFVQELNGAASAKVDIDFGAGQLDIQSGAQKGELVRGKLGYTNTLNYYQNFEVLGDTAVFKINSKQTDIAPKWLFNPQGGDNIIKWDINLSAFVPLELDINTGVGQSELDLSELNITELDVSVGVGESTIYLPSTGQFEAHISGGIGKLVVYIPEGMAARVHVSSGLGNTRMVGSFIQQNGSYTTPGYENSENWVDLFVSGGIGEIQIVFADNL